LNWRGWQNSLDHNHNHNSSFNHDHDHQRIDPDISPILTPFTSFNTSDTESSTLCMGNLEPWMDHEYASQVIRLMGWDRLPTNNAAQNTSVTIKIPPPPTDTTPQPNNPGYCLLTFPSAAQAASVLASLHSVNSKDPAGAPLLMPNSSRPFNVQWATPSQVLQASVGGSFGGAPQNTVLVNPMVSHNNAAQQGPQREYSIFVGDLAPETSNSDLVAVFRNPVLGLRNDRQVFILHLVGLKQLMHP
jgi:hypothetical protein